MNESQLASLMRPQCNYSSNFDYFGDKPLGDTRGIAPISIHRDIGLLAQSNWQCIIADLESESELSDQWEIMHSSHWLVGWIDQLIVQIYDDNGDYAPIMSWLVDVINKLDNYPVYDDTHYYDMVFERTLENIVEAVRYWRHDDYELMDDLPEGYAYTLYSWYADNDQSAIENVNDRGGYPDDDQLTTAFLALNWVTPVEDIAWLVDEVKRLRKAVADAKNMAFNVRWHTQDISGTPHFRAYDIANYWWEKYKGFDTEEQE